MKKKILIGIYIVMILVCGKLAFNYIYNGIVTYSYHQENYSVVKSNRLGLLQHDPFSWQVEEGSFVRLEEISAGARHMDNSLNLWLSTQSDSQREDFVNALFGVLESFNIKNFSKEEWDWQQLPAMLGTLKNMDEETHRMLRSTLREIAKMSVLQFSKSAKKKD